MVYELMEFDFDPDCLDYYGGNYFATKEDADFALKQAVSKLSEEERNKPPFIKEISEGSTYYAENILTTQTLYNAYFMILKLPVNQT